MFPNKKFNPYGGAGVDSLPSKYGIYVMVKVISNFVVHSLGSAPVLANLIYEKNVHQIMDCSCMVTSIMASMGVRMLV